MKIIRILRVRVVKIVAAVSVSAAAIWLCYIALNGWLYVRSGLLLKIGPALSSTRFPVDAAEFVERNKIGGNVFNDDAFGGYLLYEWNKSRKIFIDGRLNILYPPELVPLYGMSKTDPNVFESVSAKYNINAVVIRSDDPQSMNLIKYLLSKPQDWAFVHIDPVAIVFVRRAGNEVAVQGAEKRYPEGLLTALKSDVAPEIIDNSDKDILNWNLTRAKLLVNFKMYGDAIKACEIVLNIEPRQVLALNAIGLLKLQNNPQEAILYFDKAIKVNCFYKESYYNKGRALNMLETLKARKKHSRRRYGFTRIWNPQKRTQSPLTKNTQNLTLRSLRNLCALCGFSFSFLSTRTGLLSNPQLPPKPMVTLPSSTITGT